MRLLLSANRGFALLGSRRVLMSRLLADGHQVAVATADDDEARALEELGVHRFIVNYRRGGGALGADLRTLGQLVRAYRTFNPFLVHHFHAKPMFYGAQAAQFAGVPLVVNTVTGLGESLPDRGMKARFGRGMYAYACRVARFTVFQNSDDQALFRRYGLVPSGRERLITSSGVDVGRFKPAEVRDAPARVVCMARLLKKKGIREFIEVARSVRSRGGANIVFELAGEWDLGHPDAVTEADLAAWNHDGVVRFVGYCAQPEKWLQGASVFVCPSIYREGVPRVILEAAACGVPVIGTDAPGIRDVLQEGETGYLVPPNDVAAITDRLLQILTSQGEVTRMGARARSLMEDVFDIERVTAQYYELYREAGLR